MTIFYKNVLRISNWLDNYFIIEYIRKLTKLMVIVAFIIIILSVFSQVVARYVFNDAFRWSEELARYLQVWMILLCSAMCLRKETHIVADYVTHNMRYSIKRILKLIIYFFIMVYLYYLTVYGFKIVGVISTQYSPALQLPMDIVYLAVPIGGATMFIEAFIIFLKTLGSPKESQILKETSTKNW